jgi:hypothetical protein
MNVILLLALSTIVFYNWTYSFPMRDTVFSDEIVGVSNMSGIKMIMIVVYFQVL